MGTPLISDLIGCKYSEQGETREQGFSCLGLALEVYRRTGRPMRDPRLEEVVLEECGPEWPNLALVTYGDAFADHCAVYLGYGLVIHSAPGVGVEVCPVTKPGKVRRVFHHDS